MLEAILPYYVIISIIHPHSRVVRDEKKWGGVLNTHNDQPHSFFYPRRHAKRAPIPFNLKANLRRQGGREGLITFPHV